MSDISKGEIHIEDNDAMAGEKTGHMRWVLGISLAAVIAILSFVWITGAASQGDIEGEATVSAKQQEMMEGEGTDGIVSDRVEETDGVEAAISAAETDLDASAENPGIPMSDGAGE